MKTTFVKLAAVGLFAAALLGTPASSIAGTNPPPAQAAAARGLPFHGKVAAVDAAAMTVTVGARVFKVSDGTKITRNGAASTLAEVTTGDTVGGAYLKADDGAMTATTLNFNTGEDKKKEKAAGM